MALESDWLVMNELRFDYPHPRWLAVFLNIPTRPEFLTGKMQAPFFRKKNSFSPHFGILFPQKVFFSQYFLYYEKSIDFLKSKINSIPQRETGQRLFTKKKLAKRILSKKPVFKTASLAFFTPFFPIKKEGDRK